MAAGKLLSSINLHPMLASPPRLYILLQAHLVDMYYHNSRQAIKKYVKANNKITITSEAQFDSMFNKALKSGVDKGDFTQPKGMLHTVPLVALVCYRSALEACIKSNPIITDASLQVPLAQ